MTKAKFIPRFLSLMTVYVLTVCGVAWLMSAGIVTGVWKVPIGLLPIAPAAGMLFIFMARFRACDELQRNIQSEGLSFSVGATTIITLSYGFLQFFAGAPDVSWIWVWPILGLTWALGSSLARRRYQ